MDDSIPDLKIERMDDGIGDGLILLTQDDGGTIDRVAIHPLHLRYMAEKFGLVASSDPQALKTAATLTRRLHLLSARLDHLAQSLAKHSDSKPLSIAYELTYAKASADLAAEFCADLDGPTPPPMSEAASLLVEAGEQRQTSLL